MQKRPHLIAYPRHVFVSLAVGVQVESNGKPLLALAQKFASVAKLC